jgi:ATP-dependent Clp protease ATP-binding subunit ClpA
MFERFTERSRRVVVMAQEEARMLDHSYIGTEHLLLGLLHERDGIAAQAIESAGLTLDGARAEVEAIIGRGGSAPTGHIPFTPRAKKVLEIALREALTLQRTYIGPEHILLGLMRETDGVGARILERLAVPLSVLRDQVIELAEVESVQPEQVDPLAAEWVPHTRVRRARAISVPAEQLVGGQSVTAAVAEFRQTLASLGRALEALDGRLAVIEGRLGIAAAAPAEAAAEAEAEAAAEADAPAPEGGATPGDGAAPEEAAGAGDAPGESSQ